MVRWALTHIATTASGAPFSFRPITVVKSRDVEYSSVGACGFAHLPCASPVTAGLACYDDLGDDIAGACRWVGKSQPGSNFNR